MKVKHVSNYAVEIVGIG